MAIGRGEYRRSIFGVGIYLDLPPFCLFEESFSRFSLWVFLRGLLVFLDASVVFFHLCCGWCLGIGTDPNQCLGRTLAGSGFVNQSLQTMPPSKNSQAPVSLGFDWSSSLMWLCYFCMVLGITSLLGEGMMLLHHFQVVPGMPGAVG